MFPLFLQDALLFEEINSTLLFFPDFGMVLELVNNCQCSIRGFESPCSELFFSIYQIIPTALGHAIYSASNRN
jgi:hypothetical protein